MDFREHSGLRGKHAFLSPSNYHWTNYDEEKLRSRWYASRAAQRGVDLHAFAHEAIRLGIRLPRDDEALHAYVNDGIDYGMRPEQALVYSENCYGHADTIGFKNMFLRIHDLKTGLIGTKFRQLEIYAALFFLEYGFSPYEVDVELRIYQRQEVLVNEPDPEHLIGLMDLIIDFDKMISELRAGEA